VIPDGEEGKMAKGKRFISWIGSTAVMLFLFAFVAFASPQDMQHGQMGGQGHRMMQTPEQRLQMMTKQLTLTSDEQAKIKPILEDEQKKTSDLRSDSTLSREDRFQKMQQIRQDSSKQIRALLTTDQQKKYDQMEEEQQKHMQEMRQHRGDTGPGMGPGAN
jgi:periplasmic protein CpxP/Spy